MIRPAPRIVSPMICLALAAGFATSATAQVAVDQGALDSLAPTKPATPAPAAAPPAHPEHHPPPRPRPKTASQPPAPAKPRAAPSSAASAPVAKPAPVVIPPAPPPRVSLETPALPPPHTVPDAPIPVSAAAAGEVAKILGGLRVTFGAGSADLNPATEAALRSLAHTIGADPAATFNLYAYAAGSPDDPSTPRRLSLSRVLAARAVLLSEGIASPRIYPHAMGATPSDGPPDRVDVTQVGVAKPPS